MIWKNLVLLLRSADINSGVELLMKIADKYNLFYLFGISYRIWLHNHSKLYLKRLYSDESICKIEFCNRYGSENYNELKVVAKRDIKKKKNEIICGLVGVCRKMSSIEEDILKAQKLNFSIMRSERYKIPFLMLGPAAFINHDCKPNSCYSVREKNQIVITAMKNIERESEILCSYGDEYFDAENKSCECKTCEENDAGIFSTRISNSGKV